MKEMLIVGRGGEGVVVASQILADTLARAGFWVQSFPEFKAERRGAPISAFLRWDARSPIHRRYKVTACDVLLSITPAPPPPHALATVRPGGLAVLNRESRYPHTAPFRIVRVPASRIAQQNGVLSSEGRPMGNVTVLGAAVRQLLPDGLEYLEQAVRLRMGGALAEANIAAARTGYVRCIRQHAAAGDTPIEVAPDLELRRLLPVFPTSTRDSRSIQTGTWSLDRPVLLHGCTACAVCALFCPEGAITRDDDTMAIDYLHCKGCGICEVICPVRNAIAMEAVGA